MSSPAHIPGVESVSTRMRVGEWTVFPDLRRMQRDDEVARVSPKAMAVLVHLTGRAGQVVGREDLLATVWNGTLPTDDVLTQAIAELRRVFEDDRSAPRYIETIPKTGYRLIAPLTDGQPARPLGASSGTRGRRSRIALGLTLAVASLALLASAGRWLQWQDQSPSIATGSGLLDLSTRPVTSEPGPQRQPALSPGGDRVAYVARSSASDSFDLFVRTDAESPGLRLTATSDGDYSPTWSPDGGRIAFVRFNDRGCRVMVIPAVGGEPRTVAQCPAGGIISLDWSPDSGWIAFSWFREGQEIALLHEVSVDTGEVRPVDYDFHPPYHDIHPRYSPDGTLIAFQRRLGDYNEAFVVPRGGGSARRVTYFNGRITGLDWWDDGESLVVSSDHGGSRGLWRVGLDGAAAFLGLTGARYPSTVPGPRVVAFERGTDSTNLTRLGLDTDPEHVARVIYPSTRRESAPRYSPDGRRLLFVSERTGTSQLWVAEGDRVSRLTHHHGARVGAPEWHPDGRRALYVLHEDPGGGLFLVDTVAQQVRRLTGPGLDVAAAVFDRSGDQIYLSAREDAEWRIRRMSLDGSEVTALPLADAHKLAVNRRGDYLYFSKLQGDGLWRAPLDGGEPEKVSTRVKYWNRAAWELVGDTVYYLDMASAGTTLEIHRLDLVDGETRRIREIGFATAEHSLTVSPDGRSAVLVSEGPEASDVLIARLD